MQTAAEMKEYICRRLGSGVVSVELTDAQLDDAVYDAVAWWQTWVGWQRAVLLTLSGTTEIAASAIAADIDYVTEVVFEGTGDKIWDAYRWAEVDVAPMALLFGARFDHSAYVQMLQYLEEARQITSSDRTWVWDRARRVLVISPDPDAGSRVMVYYTSTEADLSVMQTTEFKLVRDYAMAQAMKTLAAIRMKFADKPGAGGNFTLDGDAMWANAEALETQVEEKMRAMQEPVGFIAD